MDDTSVYRKTEKGTRELAEYSLGLPQMLRRALILLDGNKDIAELSVSLRAGETETTLRALLHGGFIELVPESELDPERVAYVPAASDPAEFDRIKRDVVGKIILRAGRGGIPLAMELGECETALDMRLLLRKIEHMLVTLLGHPRGVELAREIGAELTRLVVRGKRLNLVPISQRGEHPAAVTY